MYYILNYIPCALLLIFFAIPINMNVNFAVYSILYLLVMPTYLLVVNWWYLKNGNIRFLQSVMIMISVVLFCGISIMVVHKLQTGYFLVIFRKEYIA